MPPPPAKAIRPYTSRTRIRAHWGLSREPIPCTGAVGSTNSQEWPFSHSAQTCEYGSFLPSAPATNRHRTPTEPATAATRTAASSQSTAITPRSDNSPSIQPGECKSSTSTGSRVNRTTWADQALRAAIMPIESPGPASSASATPTALTAGSVHPRRARCRISRNVCSVPRSPPYSRVVIIAHPFIHGQHGS